MYQENQDRSCVYQTWKTKIHIQEASSMVKQHRTSSNIIEHHQHHRTHFLLLLLHHHHHHHIAKQRTKTQKSMWTIGNLSKRPAISHCHLPGATTSAPGGTAVAKRMPGTAGTGSSTCEGEFGAVEFGSIYTDSLWFTHTMKNVDLTWLDYRKNWEYFGG